MHVVEGELNFGWESRRKFIKDAAFGIKLYGILDSVHRTRRERSSYRGRRMTGIFRKQQENWSCKEAGT